MSDVYTPVRGKQFPSFVFRNSTGYILRIPVPEPVKHLDIPPPRSIVPAEKTFIWPSWSFQVLLVASEYCAALLEFITWSFPPSWEPFKAQVADHARQFIHTAAPVPPPPFPHSLGQQPDQAAAPTPFLAHLVWAAFTHCYFHGLLSEQSDSDSAESNDVKNANDTANANNDETDSLARVDASRWLRRLVGEWGWQDTGPVCRAARAWVGAMLERLEAFFPGVGRSSAREWASAQGPGSAVVREVGVRGDLRFTDEEGDGGRYMPMYPLRLTAERLTGRSQLKWTLQGQRAPRTVSGSCGVPGEFRQTSNCALGYLVLSDVIEAFCNAFREVVRPALDRKDELQKQVIRDFIDKVLGSDTAALKPQHIYLGYPSYLVACALGWRLALDQLPDWIAAAERCAAAAAAGPAPVPGPWRAAIRQLIMPLEVAAITVQQHPLLQQQQQPQHLPPPRSQPLPTPPSPMQLSTTLSRVTAVGSNGQSALTAASAAAAAVATTAAASTGPSAAAVLSSATVTPTISPVKAAAAVGLDPFSRTLSFNLSPGGNGATIGGFSTYSGRSSCTAAQLMSPFMAVQQPQRQLDFKLSSPVGPSRNHHNHNHNDALPLSAPASFTAGAATEPVDPCVAMHPPPLNSPTSPAGRYGQYQSKYHQQGRHHQHHHQQLLQLHLAPHHALSPLSMPPPPQPPYQGGGCGGGGGGSGGTTLDLNRRCTSSMSLDGPGLEFGASTLQLIMETVSDAQSEAALSTPTGLRSVGLPSDGFCSAPPNYGCGIGPLGPGIDLGFSATRCSGTAPPMLPAWASVPAHVGGSGAPVGAPQHHQQQMLEPPPLPLAQLAAAATHASGLLGEDELDITTSFSAMPSEDVQLPSMEGRAMSRNSSRNRTQRTDVVPSPLGLPLGGTASSCTGCGSMVGVNGSGGGGGGGGDIGGGDLYGSAFMGGSGGHIAFGSIGGGSFRGGNTGGGDGSRVAGIAYSMFGSTFISSFGGEHLQPYLLQQQHEQQHQKQQHQKQQHQHNNHHNHYLGSPAVSGGIGGGLGLSACLHTQHGLHLPSAFYSAAKPVPFPPSAGSLGMGPPSRIVTTSAPIPPLPPQQQRQPQQELQQQYQQHIQQRQLQQQLPVTAVQRRQQHLQQQHLQELKQQRQL